MKNIGIVSTLSILLYCHTNYCSDTMQRALEYVSFTNNEATKPSLYKAFTYKKNPATREAIVAAHCLASKPGQPQSGTGAREAVIHSMVQQAKHEKVVTIPTTKTTGLLDENDLKAAESLMVEGLLHSKSSQIIPRNLALTPDMTFANKTLNSVFDPNAHVHYVTINIQDLSNPQNQILPDMFKLVMLCRNHDTKKVLEWLTANPFDKNADDYGSLKNMIYDEIYDYNDNKDTYNFIYNNQELNNFCCNNQRLPELSLVVDTGDLTTLHEMKTHTQLVPFCKEIVPSDDVDDDAELDSFDDLLNIIDATNNDIESIRITGKNLKTILSFPLDCDKSYYGTCKIGTFILPDSVEEIGNNVFSQVNIANFQSSKNLSKVGYRFLCHSKVKHLTLPSFIATRGPDFLTHCYDLETIIINDQLFDDLGGDEFFHKQNFPALKQCTRLHPNGSTSTKNLS